MCTETVIRPFPGEMAGTDGPPVIRLLRAALRDPQRRQQFSSVLHIAFGFQTEGAIALKLFSNAVLKAMPCMDLLVQAGMFDRLVQFAL